MLQAKKKRHQRVKHEDTAITVKLNKRSQANLENFYSSTNINWTPVEKQLRKWSNLLRMGKKLRSFCTAYWWHRSGLKKKSSIPTIATLLQMETSEIFLARTGHLQSENGDVGLLDRRLQRREGCRRTRSTPYILRRKQSYVEAYLVYTWGVLRWAGRRKKPLRREPNSPSKRRCSFRRRGYRSDICVRL